MSQIRKGFIAANAIDGSKLKLLNNEAIRAAQADGADVELMKLDGSNVLQFLKLPQVSADPSQGNDVARKSYVDAQVSAAGDSAAAGLASEQSARESADSGLQSAIDTEKGRIDAILSAATADADSFAEIVNLINSVDTESDSAFGSYVISNNAALAQESADRAAGDASLSSDVADEASARQSADTALQGNLDQEVSDRQAAVSSEASARQSADVGLQSQINSLNSRSSSALSTETAARQAADSAEQSARESADSSLQANIDAEAGTRGTADAALSGRLDVLEADPVTKSYVDTWGGDEANTRSAADANLQSQIDNLTSNLDPAALDSLTEIVGAFQAADSDLTAAVTALGTSASSAVAAEESRATAAEAALQAAISSEVSRAQGQEAAIDTRFTNDEAASAAEVSNRQAAVSAEESARQAADASLQGEVDAVESALAQEVSNRQAAVSSEAATREAADSALDVRVDAIEAVTSRKEKIVLSADDASNGYIDLAVTCKADSEMVFIGSLYAHDGDDYTVSTTNNKTRIFFAGPLAAGGVSQLVTGDVVYVRYLSSETGSGGGGGGQPSSAYFMSASFGAAVGIVNWMALGATTENVRLEYDMAGFWLHVGNLGPAFVSQGYTPSPLNLGGTYRLVFTEGSGTTVIGSPSMSFTYMGAGPGPGPGPVTYSFPMVIGQTDNGDGTTTFDWSGATLPMMQEVRLVKVIGPSMYDIFNGVNLGVLTPTSSGVISSSDVSNYDSYALQTFMGPTSTATSASFQIPSGTGI